MNFIYIKQTTDIEEILPKTKFKLPNFCKSFIFNIKKIFYILTLKDDVLILPLQDKDKINSKQWMAFSKKTNEFIKKHKIKKIALSNFLNEVSLFKSFFQNNIHILSGRLLFPFLSFDILQYISKQTNKELPQLEVAIISNSNTDLINSIIINLAKNVKLLTIVTDKPYTFNKLAQYLYDDLGIIVRVSNNKRKCLLKTNIILNYDFDEYELNEYSLNNFSIIISFNNKVEILSKSFAGINASSFEFTSNNDFTSLFKEKKLYSCFSNQVLLESLCLKSRNSDAYIHTFNKYNVNISGLIGNNGIINKNEFITIFSQNRLDKNI